MFFFRHGAQVILACRSAEKAAPAVEEIKKETGNQFVEFLELDLASLKSVADFASIFRAKNLPLHILLNNAGVMFTPYSLTQDGIEMQFGTNHIGHFYLTLLLFDLLDKNQPSRIVNVSSVGHSAVAPSEGIRFDKINDEASYSTTKAYGQSKLANVLFTRELARRIGGDKRIFANSLHPGNVDTDAGRHMAKWAPWFISRPLLAIFGFLALIPAQGALTQLYLCTSPEVEQQNIRGEYYIPTAKKASAAGRGQDAELAKKLWDFSVALVKEKVPSFDVPEVLRA